MGGYSALVTLALLASATGGPISSLWENDGTQCATKCTDSRKFQYQAGTRYLFDYTTETSTGMEDASEDTARLHISATAHVYVTSACDMTLQLRDIQVLESDPETGSLRPAPGAALAAARLETQDLRFSFQDGVVDALCPSSDEDRWALNIKRGFLSAFQNGMAHLDNDQTVMELDVAGHCPSQYSVVEKGWYSTTIKRSKDLLACTDRHDYQTAVSSSPYTAKSSVQSVPLLKSSHECQQTVDQYGVLSSATCNERHLFRPFSRENSGALTKVTQTLKFKGKNSGRINPKPVSSRVSLMFEHGSREEQAREARVEAEHVLRQLCRQTAADVRPDTPRLFANLVSVMRKVDASGLRSLYSQLEQNTLCTSNPRTKKFFMDALPMVGSEATVSMMSQMLDSGDVTGVEADMWLTSLALIQEPTPVMLASVQRLVKNKQLSHKATMPISSLVSHYCGVNADCGEDNAVLAIMDAFQALVGSSCYVTRKNLDDVILGLRAIGNAGHVSSAVGVVNKCLRRSKNDNEVRVLAADAFRRMPCDADRDTALDVYSDSKEDSEVRIAAYLAAITCPSTDVITRVQRVLKDEADQQVGSFVVSHLSNLQETSSPLKQEARRLLQHVQLPDNFDLGRVQFSRNYEGSLFVKRFNTGASSDANLVWSSSSSLPRSASANVTVDVFGRSLNLLQVGGRLEGLEYLLETMLGPYGYFGSSTPDDVKKSRAKLDELKGSAYMRLFGDEVTYQRFQGLDSLTSGKGFNMLDFLIKLSKDHDVRMSQSMVLMDTSMTVPTASGLPLTLTVNGTATVDLQASGKMDLRRVSAKPRSLQINGLIKPSGAVRVEGTMRVDGLVSQSALRVSGTLHSSTALQGRVDLDRGRVLAVELDIPQDKMEIFDVRSEFTIVHNTVEKQQKMMADDRRTLTLCSGAATAQALGLELCGELSYPNASMAQSGPYFPFTGPASLTIALYKRDTLSSYKLLAKRVENKKKTMAQLSFNTPGSQVDRSMAFDLALNHEDKQFEVSVASPWKKAEFKGAITNTKQLVGVSGSFVTDDVNTYAVTSEVKVSETKKGVTYNPRFEIRRPDAETVALTGAVSVVGRKSASLELSLSGLTQQPLVFKSAGLNSNKEVSVSSSASTGDKSYSLRVGSQLNMVSTKKASKMQVSPFLEVKTPRADLVMLSGSASYVQGKAVKGDLKVAVHRLKPASVQFSADMSARKAALRYKVNLNVKSSLLTAKKSTVVNVKRGRLVNGRSTLVYSVPRVARDKLVLTAKLSDRSTKAYNKYTLRSALDSKSNPDYNTAVKLTVDHKKKLSSGELEVSYGSNPKDKTKKVSVSGTLVRKIRNLRNVDLSYKMEAAAPAHGLDMRLKGKHAHSPSSLDSDVALTYAKGKEASATLTLSDKSDKLKKLNGALVLQAPSTGLTIKTGLAQPADNQWEHNLMIKTGKGAKHSMETVYTMAGPRSHEASSTVSVNGFKPLTVSGKANVDWEDLQMGANVKYGKTMYGVSGSHKMARNRSGKWGLEVQIPERRMTLDAEAGVKKGAYEASLDAAWDADNDNNAKISVDGLVSSKSKKTTDSRHARLRVFTPFQKLEKLIVSLGVDSTPSQHEGYTKVVYGGKKDVMTSSLTLSKPFSPRRAQLALKADTPFKGYGNLEVSLDHTMDNALNTKLNVRRGGQKCEMSVSGENRGTSSTRDLQGQLSVASNWRALRSLTVSAAHKDDARTFANSLNVQHNGDKYSYGMNMVHEQGSNKGDLSLAWPQDQLKGQWNHRVSGNDLSSSTSASWGKGQRAQLDLAGSHVMGATRSVSGTMALTSPWTRDWSAELKHEHGNGKISSSSTIKGGRAEYGHFVSADCDGRKSGLEARLDTPWTDAISGKLNARHADFPMSASAEFSWSPRSKVTVDGSVLVNSWDDLDINARVTTPARAMRSLAGHVSSKAEGSEVVSSARLDMGVRSSVELETRVQRDLSAARAKLKTPFENVRVIDGGFSLHPDLSDFVSNVDVKVIPALGKYEGALTFNTGDNFRARLRLDTPHKAFPYMELTANSKDKQRLRQSGVQLELSPRQTYSLDASYGLEEPLLLMLDVRTPIAGYQALGAVLKHTARGQVIKSSAEVTYGSEKSVKSALKLDWSRGLDSSLTLTTPWAGWEQSALTVRHEGQLNDFNCYGEVSKGAHALTGTLKFLNKAKTDAQLTITTPFAGYEKIDAAVSRKGDLKTLRGAASVTCGENKLAASLTNKWNDRRMRTLATLTTPFTEDDINVKLEHSGTLRQFTSEADLSMGRKYSLDGSASFNLDGADASGKAGLKYRVGGPKTELAASFGKTGELDDLALSASLSKDKREISATATLNTRRDLRASVGARTPFAGYESVGATLETSGTNGELSVEYMSGRTVSAKLESNVQSLRQLSVRGSLTSPIPGLERSAVSVSHSLGAKMAAGSLDLDTTLGGYGALSASYKATGKPSDLKAEAKISRDIPRSPSISLLDASLSHELSARRLQSSLRVISAVLPELSVELSHSGSASDFSTSYSSSLGADKLSSDTSFSVRGNNVELSQRVTASLYGANHQAGMTLSLDDASVTLAGDVNKQKGKVVAKWSADNGVSGSVDVHTPVQGYRQMGANVQYTQGRVSAAANLGRERVEATATYSADSPLSASLSVATPFQGYRRLATSASVSPSQAELSASLEDQRLQATAQYDLQRMASGSLSLDTPFPAYSNMAAAFSRRGRDVSLSANLLSDKLEVKATIPDMKNPSGSLEATTPFQGYRQMAASVHVAKDKVVAKGNLEQQEVKATVEYGKDLRVDVTTPFRGFRKMGSSLAFDGDMRQLSVEMTGFLMNERLELKGSFTNKGRMSGSLSAVTPFAGYRSLGSSFSFQGNLQQLQAEARANLEEKTIEGTASFTNARQTSGSVNVITPFPGYSAMDANFALSDDALTVSGNLEGQKIEATGKFNGLEGSLEINTPFRGYSQMGGQFSLSDNTATVSGNLERQKVEATGKFSKDNGLEGSLDVSTPFSGYSNMGGLFVLSDNALTVSGNLEGQKIEATGKFSADKAVEGSLDVSTPFDGFRSVGASFQHSGDLSNMDTQARLAYMDGQEISAKVNLFNYRLRRVGVSGELKTPFVGWEQSSVSYTHKGTKDKFQCDAQLECFKGKASATLKVDVRQDQSVELTLDLPVTGYRHTHISHSASWGEQSVQWSGAAQYGDRQRAASQMSASWAEGRALFHLEASCPFTSDLLMDYSRQGQPSSYTEKQLVKYGELYQWSKDSAFSMGDNEFKYTENCRTVWKGQPTTRSLSLLRQGPWSDVTLEAKGEYNGHEASAQGTFKNEYGRIESALKVNTPFEGFNDLGASFQHYGQLSGAFNTEVKVEYQDEQEVTAKVDFMRADWKRVEMTSQVTTPFPGLEQNSAEFRYTIDNDGLSGFAGVEYSGSERLNGELRLASSPSPEATLTIKTPCPAFRQVSATATYTMDDDKKEASAKVDLASLGVYTASTSADAGSLTARVTTPLRNWRSMETRLSAQGTPLDFQASAFLTTPLTDDVTAAASLRYVTPFDMNAAATFESAFDNFRDLKMEVSNSESETQKTSHVLGAWARGQEVVVDATWRHQTGWSDNRLHADLTVASPFQALRSASWLYESHTTQDKKEHRMEASVNGAKYVDGEVSLSGVSGDLPALSINVREPRPMLYTAQRTSHGADIGLNWDRNEPASNLRLVTSLTDNSQSGVMEHDMEAKLVHPYRTMKGAYSVRADAVSVSSSGSLAWAEGDDQRVTFTLDLADKSRRALSSYDGKIRVGAASRAVEMSGAWSASRAARAMDAALSWDAERDASKKVALQTRWTSGQKNKADVTISLPSIPQELRVTSEVSMNQGKTLLDATTAVSYSSDARKTLTLSSRLEDTTSAWSSGSNYSLSLALTQPYTALDLGLTSHVGASPDRYSAALDAWYTTARRQKKNMAIRGQIDKLRKQISMEMESPVKKVQVSGKVDTEPYSLSIANTYDDDRTIRANVALDPEARSLVIKSNYDLDNPERTLVMRALYVNDSAVRAEIVRDHVTGSITDAMLSARLNTSTLLHSRLHWRTASLAELQDFLLYKLATYGTRSQQTVTDVSEALGEELGARYAHTASALAQDLQPLITGLNTELSALGTELTRLRRQLNRAYRRNHFYIQDMGDGVASYYSALQDSLARVSAEYQAAIEGVSGRLEESLDSMKRFPVRQHYRAAVGQLTASLQRMLDAGVTKLSAAVERLDKHLLAVSQHTAQLRKSLNDAVYNNTLVRRVQQYGSSVDVSPYVTRLGGQLRALSVPEQYTAPLYAASAHMRHVLGHVMARPELQQVGQAANELYQQGVWAYHYWDVEQNLQRHLASIVSTLQDIAADELEVYAAHFRFLRDSRISVWSPEAGEVQAELALPVAMETLDSLPDVTPVVRQYNNAVGAVNNYLPDKQTVVDMYNNYGPQTWWPENSTKPVPDVLNQVEEFAPSQLPKRKNMKYYRNRKVVRA